MTDTEENSNLINLTDGINKIRRSRNGHRPFVRKLQVTIKLYQTLRSSQHFIRMNQQKSVPLLILCFSKYNLAKAYAKTFWILCNTKVRLNLKSMMQLIFALYINENQNRMKMWLNLPNQPSHNPDSHFPSVSIKCKSRVCAVKVYCNLFQKSLVIAIEKSVLYARTFSFNYY